MKAHLYFIPTFMVLFAISSVASARCNHKCEDNRPPVAFSINRQFENLIACTPPSVQPTNLSLLPTDSSIQISFSAIPNAPEDVVYLILLHHGPAPGGEPKDGESYNDNGGIGDARVIHLGPETQFTAMGLNKDFEYYITVYAANKNGPCYNRTNPLREKKMTNKTAGPVGSGKSEATNKLSTLLNFNFAGEQNGWTNLIPVVFYGWTKTGKNNFRVKNRSNKKPIGIWKNAFQMGPYIGTTTALKDSTSFLPSLMLPGNGGLQVNYFMTFFNDSGFNIKFSPVNFGLKVISGYADTTLSVVQHNLRTSVAIEFADYFNASVQFTRGWHNLTTKSGDNFSTIFSSPDTKITYWNVNLTTRLSDDLFGKDQASSPIFLSISWHSLARTSHYGGLPNSKFITIGLLTDLNITSGSHPGHVPKAPNF